MIVYLDENMPKHLAHGFNLIQIPENLRKGRTEIQIKFLPDIYGYSVDDLDWIPKVGQDNGFVITQDIHITKRKDEIKAYQDLGIGLFLLRGKSKKQGLSVWEMVQILAKNWEDMVDIMINNEGPFAYTVQQNRRISRYK